MDHFDLDEDPGLQHDNPDLDAAFGIASKVPTPPPAAPPPRVPPVTTAGFPAGVPAGGAAGAGVTPAQPPFPIPLPVAVVSGLVPPAPLPNPLPVSIVGAWKITATLPSAPLVVTLAGPMPLPVSIVGGGGGGPAGPPGPTWFNPKAEALRRVKSEAAYQNLTQGPGEELVPKPPPDTTGDSLKYLGKLFSQSGMPNVGRLAGTIGEAKADPSAITQGAAAFTIADTAAKLFAGTLDMAGAGVRTLGETAGRAAGNDNLGALVGAAESVAGALGKIPVIGAVFESEIKLVTTTIRAFADTVQAFVDRGAELEKFSGEIAQARAQAAGREIGADIHEADTLGPAIAALTDQQSRASTEIREALLPLKKLAVEGLTELLQDARGAVLIIRDEVRLAVIALQFLAEKSGFNLLKYDAQIALLDRIGKLLKQRVDMEEQKESTGAGELLMNQLRGLGQSAALQDFGNSVQRNPLQLAVEQAMNGPAFGGF